MEFNMKFKIGDTVVHERPQDHRRLVVEVTGQHSDVMFKGTVLSSTHPEHWEVGRKDLWVIDRFEKIPDIHEEFDSALNKLESRYDKV